MEDYNTMNIADLKQIYESQCNKNPGNKSKETLIKELIKNKINDNLIPRPKISHQDQEKDSLLQMPKDKSVGEEKGEESDNIILSRDQYDTIMDKIGDLTKKTKNLEKVNAGNLQFIQDEDKKSLGKTIRIAYFELDNQKIVIKKWEGMTKNICGKNILGGFQEILEIKIIMEDGTPLNLPYKEFLNRKKMSQPLEVLGERVDNKTINPHGNPSKYYSVKFNNKDLEIEETFINPS